MPRRRANRQKKYRHAYRVPETGKRTSTYLAWCAMKYRCLNPTNRVYKYYGARGITVCDRWRYSFDHFVDDLGECPKGLWLERINNDGNYEPTNCKWATPTEQANNRRNGRSVNPNSLRQKALRAGLRYSVVYQRVLGGWDEQTALTTPARGRIPGYSQGRQI